jgi:hypothetical protein
MTEAQRIKLTGLVSALNEALEDYDEEEAEYIYEHLTELWEKIFD